MNNASRVFHQVTYQKSHRIRQNHQGFFDFSAGSTHWLPDMRAVVGLIFGAGPVPSRHLSHHSFNLRNFHFQVPRHEDISSTCLIQKLRIQPSSNLTICLCLLCLCLLSSLRVSSSDDLGGSSEVLEVFQGFATQHNFPKPKCRTSFEAIASQTWDGSWGCPKGNGLKASL